MKMKADLLVLLVGVLHVLQINGQKTMFEQKMEARFRLLENRVTDLEVKVLLLSSNEKVTSTPSGHESTSESNRHVDGQNGAMKDQVESLESIVLDWRNKGDLLEKTVEKLAHQYNATEDKVVALDAKNRLLEVALNTTRQEVVELQEFVDDYDSLDCGFNGIARHLTGLSSQQLEEMCPPTIGEASICTWQRLFGCYCVSGEQKNWRDAQEVCQSYRMDLVAIETEREQKFVAGLISTALNGTSG